MTSELVVFVLVGAVVVYIAYTFLQHHESFVVARTIGEVEILGREDVWTAVKVHHLKRGGTARSNIGVEIEETARHTFTTKLSLTGTQALVLSRLLAEAADDETGP